MVAATEENRPVAMKVRALLVDGRLQEHTLGPRTVVRGPPCLSSEWQPSSGFRFPAPLAVATRRLASARFCWTALALPSRKLLYPEFDPYYSVASWYRDYVAYCGVSEEGKKLYPVVA